MTTPATYTRVLPGPTERRLASTLSSMDADIAALYEGLRAVQLGKSTLAGTLVIRDPDGTLTGLIGQQPDGTAGVTIQNASPPPRPNTATMTPFPAGVYVEWNGTFPSGPRPANFNNVEVYLGASPTMVLGPSTFVGTLSEAGHLPVGPLSTTTPVYAILIATNLAEDPANVGTGLRPSASEPSLVSAGVTPAQVVAQAVLDGIINSVALADDAVSRAKLQADAVDGTKIADGSIQTPHMVASSIDANVLAAQTIYSGLIATDAIDARTIAALAVQADALAANSVQAGAISAGAVTAAKLETDLLLASRIAIGSLAGNRLELHPITGLQGFFGGTRTLWWDNSTGSLFARGQWSTADSGTRLVMNPDGTAPDELRFYQSATAYAWLNAEPGTQAGTAALIGRSQAVNGKRSSLGIYPAEAFIAFQDSAANTSESAASMVTGAANIWGGKVSLEAREQYGDGRIYFGVRNSSNSQIANAALRYQRTSASDPEAMLYSEWRDLALYWSRDPTGVGLYVGNFAGVGRPITASAFPLASSGTIKKNVKANALMAGKAATAVRGLTVRQYNYVGERAPGEPAGPPRKHVRREERRDGRGRLLVDPATGEPLYDEIEEDIPPVPERKPHIGFVAEEVEAVLPEVVRDVDIPGGKVIDTNSLLAVVVQAVQELAEAQRGGGAAVVADPAAPANGSFFERGGTLYYRNSVGVERKVA